MRAIRSFGTTCALILFAQSSISQVTAPCVDGFAGIYPCSGYDLVAHLSVAQLGGGFNVEGNDIWGWTDPQSGKEYVIIGLTDGTAFVDISDPVNPQLVGNLPTHTSNSLWRDVKVYNDHAFIVSEAGGHGMQVFDLTQLGGVTSPPVTFSNTAHYSGFGNAHNIVINEASGYAYGVGTGTYSGGLHFVDISNPSSPTLAGGFSADGYTHDAQVVSYIGPDPQHQGKEIAFASNEDTFTIIDVSDKTDPSQLSRTGYTGSAYTHQGWATEDHRFYMMNDELDENSAGHNTRTYIWNIEDLDNPSFLGYYQGPTGAIDHNLYIKGDRAYEANYRAGLRVLDISDVANGNLTEVGFFDVYPNSDGTGFNGAWSNYPYFESGNIVISSIEDGLFIVRASEPLAEHCTNGVQDADETGVDCGGVDCFDCPLPCINDMTLTIILDNYPEETTWTVTDAGGTPVESGGAYGSQPDGSTVIEEFCLSNGCFDLNFFDSFGDGICCGYGEGSYSLTDAAGNVLASGGSFASSETTGFCVESGPDCALFSSAPVDLTKSQQPVPFPDGNIDRVQVKWYKESPQIKYTAEDNSAVDIQFWAIRDLTTNTPIVGADTSLISKRTKPGQDFFKWPIKFQRSDVDPNTRYQWRVRTYCEAGDGQVSPWSETKIFNTPDFDPLTGIYTPPGGTFSANELKSRSHLTGQELWTVYPNPFDGKSIQIASNMDLEDLLIEVYDISGKSIYSRSISMLSSGQELRLDDVNIYQSGVYLIRMQAEDHVYSQMISVISR
ncbi:MAG: choice-of-anchor B family protein [Flavobacteriales bacterium]|nr:choice-of-anchor B family protein [Flavobacteriales bacterium]